MYVFKIYIFLYVGFKKCLIIRWHYYLIIIKLLIMELFVNTI